MTTREAFKFGFLLRCAQEGLTLDQTEQRINDILEKKAAWVGPALANLGGRIFSTGGTIASSVLPFLLQSGLVLGIGGPALAGMGGGYLAAKLRSGNVSEIEEAKTNEILAEYQRLTDQARRQSESKRIAGKPSLAYSIAPPKE
jgi:hypothetical protein